MYKIMEDKRDIQENAIEWYISNEFVFKKLAKKVENILIEIFNSTNVNYHIVTSRSKDIESFRKKISKDKYDNPIIQIKDLAGIRVITYVEDEVKAVCRTIEDAFQIDKDNSLDKSEELGIDKVGYKSIHYIASLKEDRLKLPEYKIYENRVFEIQVRTILQHAWAEIEHDRNYKFSGKLPDEISRRFKLLAGSLEISDREFNNISKEIDAISREVAAGMKKGKLDFDVNSTSLKQFMETKFEVLESSGFTMDRKFSDDILKELSDYGINTLHDFDIVIPKDLVSVLTNNKEELKNKLSFGGLIRLILILNDGTKYFSKSWNTKWKVWSRTKNYNNVYDQYKVDVDGIFEKFNVILKYTAPKEPEADNAG
jgi:putative GTP pyrophosphokinase